MIDKKLFYENYRKEFGRLKQSVVDCCDAIIDEFNKHKEQSRDIEKKAYMLATVRHEVGPDMIPIVENMNYSAQRITEVWPSRFKTISAAKPYAHNPEKLGNNVYGNRLGNGPPSSGDGYRYRGRGIGDQFTGKVNYEKFSKLFKVDLVNNPELAVDLNLGAKILYKGSTEGLFTGVGLSKYITPSKVDYINARRVINADVGRNGARIAKDAVKFERILRNSSVKDLMVDEPSPPSEKISVNINPDPVNTPEKPDSSPVREQQTSSPLMNFLMALIRGLFGGKN